MTGPERRSTVGTVSAVADPNEPVSGPLFPAPPARILVVCTANICRSPMTAALLEAHLDRTLPADQPRPVITSAGTHARVGDPAAERMVVVAERWGLDLSTHRSRPVDAELVGGQDVVLTMEDRHRKAVSRLAAGATQRTFLLTEFARLIQDLDASAGGGGDLPSLLQQLQGRRAGTTRHHDDIPDPYGGPDEGYGHTARQLAALVEQFGRGLSSHLRGPQPTPDR